MKIGLLFIGYDQFQELKWTLHIIRQHWSMIDQAPIAVVLSGDPDQQFQGYGETIVKHVPNIVEYSVSDLVDHLIMETAHERPGIGKMHYREPMRSNVHKTGSESIFRNYQVGVNAMKEVAPDIDVLLVTESNILLLDEYNIVVNAKEMLRRNAVAAVHTCRQSPTQYLPWDCTEIMPQLFLVDWRFCLESGFLFEYLNTRPDCMEMSLSDDLKRCLSKVNKNFNDDVWNVGDRGQWGIHLGWIPFAHLDRPIGADDDASARWDSRELQLGFEQRVLQYYGWRCLQDPCS